MYGLVWLVDVACGDETRVKKCFMLQIFIFTFEHAQLACASTNAQHIYSPYLCSGACNSTLAALQWAIDFFGRLSRESPCPAASRKGVFHGGITTVPAPAGVLSFPVEVGRKVEGWDRGGGAERSGEGLGGGLWR